MSNQLRKGKRLEVRRKNKEDKQRVQEIYKILAHLDTVAKEIVDKEDQTVDDVNILEIASKYSDRKLGEYEKLMLLVKLEELGKVNKEDILKDEVSEDI